MTNYIHPITLEAAMEVASSLRPEDFREVYEGHGLFPLFSIPRDALNGDTVYFTAPNGKTAGIAGVQQGGLIWMLCTPVVEKYPHTFARQAKQFIDSRTEPVSYTHLRAHETLR